MEKISGTKEWAVAAMEKQRDRNIRPSATPRENPRHRKTVHNTPPPPPRENPTKGILLSADLPWPYAPRRNSAKFGQGAAGRYGLMSAEELIRLGPLVKSIVEQEVDAALFLWAVWPRLPLALQVIEAWGFRYATAAFVWAKTTKGGGFHCRCGYYTASNTEPVLLGVSGRMCPDVKLTPQVIAVPPGKHSAKPEEMQDRIELMYPRAKKIELFARRVRPGWICLGNEITGRDIREDLRQLLGRNDQP